jgi:hypothetical protein
MTFRCDDLERALASDDPTLGEAARAHAKSCASCQRTIDLDEEITAAARTLHREWESDALWPSIAGTISDRPRQSWDLWSWQGLAAAAVLVLTLAGSIMLLRDRPFTTTKPADPLTADRRLLSDEALSEVERAEAQYVDAIEALARKANAPSDRPESALLVNLRERLLVIDAAIADCRAEIERNRFNAHLRRQLLSIYQEKRRTLEQILEQEQNAS